MAASGIQLGQTGRSERMPSLDCKRPPMSSLSAVGTMSGVLAKADDTHLVCSLGVATLGSQAKQAYAFLPCAKSLTSKQ